MFGQTGNSSFGNFNNAQSSPFGSAFGKPAATTSFGTAAAPVFGNNTSLFSSKPAGTSTGGLFGNTTITPTFGATATTQSTFGGFGTTMTNNTPIFGTQPSTSSNLFGSTAAAPAFGQANKTTTFGFGQQTNTSLFGQPQQQAQTTPFGQSAAGTGSLFGGGFGNTNTVGGITGTVVKFTPVSGTDTMLKAGVTHNIQTRHHCITCMKEYETKSLEELRLEDYVAGRKGPVQGQQPAGGIFAQQNTTSPFSSMASSSGTTTTGFGQISSGFGSTNQTSSLFSKPITGFGTPATTSSTFSFNTNANTNLFSNQAKPFGATTTSSLFSNTNTATPSFGMGLTNPQNTSFSSGFNTQPQANQSIGLFSQNKPVFNTPASTATTTFGFGQTSAANTTGNLFAPKPAGTTGFGTNTFAAPSTSAFQTAGTGFGQTQNNNTSLFNTSFKPAGQTTGFTFGNPTSLSTGGLGTNTGLSLGTGGSNLFSGTAKPNLFGTTSTFNTTGAFGSMPGFGSGTSNTMHSLGGSNLFAGTGTGMNLNPNMQQNSSSVPVHQQILALVSAPFGDSPLLKNLLPASGKTDQLLKPQNAVTKSSLNSPLYKVNAVSNSSSPKVKPKVIANSVPMSKKSIFEGLDDEDPLTEAFQPRQNAKRLVLRPRSSEANNSLEQAKKNLNAEQTSVNDSLLIDGNKSFTNQEQELINKENNSQGTNRAPALDRRSSNSWLISSLPRKTKDDIDYLNQQQQNQFYNTSEILEEFDNTVTELRPQKAGSAKHISSAKDASSSTCQEKSVNEISELNFDPDKSNIDSSVCENRSCDSDDSPSIISIAELQKPNKANVRLTRSGYYTIPPIDKLDDYVKDNTCIVPHFTVGRKGYGNVYFPESFDIYGLDLDDIVHFRHKEVIIYPDDNVKPPVGEGLNRKAQVTLDRVWPHDKSTHKEITNPERLIEMDYESKLRRVSAKHDTRFLEYRPETGSWVFKVDHFSKYGLNDSDEEDAPPPTDLKKKDLTSVEGDPNATIAKNKLLLQQQQQKQQQQLSETNLLNTYEIKNLNGFEMKSFDNEGNQVNFEKDGLVSMHAHMYGNGNSFNFDKEQGLYSPTSLQAKLMGTESHKLQLMKASFFDLSNEDEDTLDLSKATPNGSMQELMNKTDESIIISNASFMKSMEPKHLLRQSTYLDYKKLKVKEKNLNNQTYKASDNQSTASKVGTEKEFSKSVFKGLPMPLITPKVSILKYNSELVPYRDSCVINKVRGKCIADIGVHMGRVFRTSWGPNLTLITPCTKRSAESVQLYSALEHVDTYISGRLINDTSSNSIIQRLQLFGGQCDSSQVFQESVEEHLKIQLQSSKILSNEDENFCPFIATSADDWDVSVLHAHIEAASKLAEIDSPESLYFYYRDVWKLCECLWGNLEDIIYSSTDDDTKRKYEIIIARKSALSEWFKSISSKVILQEVLDLEEADEIVLKLISGNKLEEACKRLRKVGDYCLALLISQLGGSLAVQELIKTQIELWQDMDVVQNISEARFKLYMLIAGMPVIRSNELVLINVCENLDWKRAFALHLWYLSPSVASLADVLDSYENAFESSDLEPYASKPFPEYFNEEFLTESCQGKPMYDLCFHLLKLYCTGKYPLEVVINPQNHTYDPLDYRLSWFLLQVLKGLGYSHLSEDAEVLTHISFATQLESFGLWHWSVFVIMHIKDTCRRRKGILDILTRHIEIDETDEYLKIERFLVENLHISPLWINESRGVKASTLKRYGEAAWYFAEAKQWNKSHDIIMEHLAPDAIINEEYEYLKGLLEMLSPGNATNSISGWSYQGQLLLDYMIVTEEIKGLLNGDNFENIGWKLEMLQPQLALLCTKINVFPCPTTKHRLCQAEIAKRTFQLAKGLHMLHSVSNHDASKVLINLISELPLPEDYAQQELRPIINICVNEIIKK